MRESVRRFAHEMETALSKHDGDRGPEGWSKDLRRELMSALQEEVEELDVAISSDDPERIMKEAADVGNFAMMVSEQARRELIN